MKNFKFTLRGPRPDPQAVGQAAGQPDAPGASAEAPLDPRVRPCSQEIDSCYQFYHLPSY